MRSRRQLDLDPVTGADLTWREDHRHHARLPDRLTVRGTVEKISSDSVIVKTVDGKSVEVKFAPSTVFLSRFNNEDKPAKASDLAAGDLVVIHATPKDNALRADEIKFSAPAAAKPAVTSPPKPNS